MCVLVVQAVWYPAEFLQTYAPYDLKKPDPPNPAAYRKNFLQLFDQSFSQRVQLLVAQTSNWFVLAESRLQGSLRHEESVRKAMDLRGSIILKGLGLAHRASYMAKYALVMHAELQVRRLGFLSDVSVRVVVNIIDCSVYVYASGYVVEDRCR